LGDGRGRQNGRDRGRSGRRSVVVVSIFEGRRLVVF
jgi:hypothetical protein